MASASCARPPSRLEEFAELAEAVGLPLERFQEKIVEAVFAGTRELLVLLPRGNGKTTIFAALALYSLLTTDEPAIYVAAASRDQASVMFDVARRLATAHPRTLSAGSR